MRVSDNIVASTVALGALAWGIPFVMGILLVRYQYDQGTGSLFLVAIGVLPFGNCSPRRLQGLIFEG